MPVRNCERCGARMSPWQPRKRIGDDLVCPGCAQKDATDLRSDRDVAFSLASRQDEGRTIHRGGNALAPPKAQAVTANAYEDSQVQWGSERAVVPQPRDLDAIALGVMRRIRAQGWGLTEVQGAILRGFIAAATMEAGWSNLPRDHQEYVEREVSRRVDQVLQHGTASASRKLAHDSGDGETIYHCPFCGAGQVTGRSDGTAECSFCQTAFTVQVQPQMAATPQTIDGVPHVHPDMPGEPGVPEDPEEDFEGTEMNLLPSEEEDQLAATSAYYLTAEGVALDHEAYLRHLAITYADDRGAVIAQVRASRKQGAAEPGDLREGDRVTRSSHDDMPGEVITLEGDWAHVRWDDGTEGGHPLNGLAKESVAHHRGR